MGAMLKVKRYTEPMWFITLLDGEIKEHGYFERGMKITGATVENFGEDENAYRERYRELTGEYPTDED